MDVSLEEEEGVDGKREDTPRVAIPVDYWKLYIPDIPNNNMMSAPDVFELGGPTPYSTESSSTCCCGGIDVNALPCCCILSMISGKK